MRIITGTAKGRKLIAPRGSTTRPTLGRARTALFDALTPWLEGARFLDLFAGTGAIGLEALSRGAAEAVFVETDDQAVRALRANSKQLQMDERARVMPVSVLTALQRLHEQGRVFDLVFTGPPYHHGWNERVLERLAELPDLLAAAAIVIAQQHHKEPEPVTEYLDAFRDRRIGDTRFIFYRRRSVG